MNAASLQVKFDRSFPVSSDLDTCLKTVHCSYRLFQIHDGHTEKDGYLEEGMYAVYPIVLHCIKEILAAGGSKKKSSCAVTPVHIPHSSPNSSV
jgi:hypothetical protein